MTSGPAAATAAARGVRPPAGRWGLAFWLCGMLLAVTLTAHRWPAMSGRLQLSAAAASDVALLFWLAPPAAADWAAAAGAELERMAR